MSDVVLRKNASTGSHEEKVVKEGRFKKTANLRVKINRTGSAVGATPSENNTRQR